MSSREGEGEKEAKEKQFMELLPLIAEKKHTIDERYTLEGGVVVVKSPEGAAEAMKKLGMAEMWLCTSCFHNADFKKLSMVCASMEEHSEVFEDLSIARAHRASGSLCEGVMSTLPKTWFDDLDQQPNLLVPFSYVFYSWVKTLYNKYFDREAYWNDDGGNPVFKEFDKRKARQEVKEEELKADCVDRFDSTLYSIRYEHNRILSRIRTRPPFSPQ